MGTGKHRHNRTTRRGIFAMEAPDGSTAQARRLALERAEVSRSTELATRGGRCWPVLWSTPVVVAIHVPTDACLHLDPCIDRPPLHKVCIEMERGAVARLSTLSVLGYVEAAPSRLVD